MNLTIKQQELYDLLLKFVEGDYKNPLHPKVLIIDGFAGTGKSTVVSLFLKYIKQKTYKYFSVLTYTGKASQVLQEKGLKEAQTIHSFLYYTDVDKNGNLIYKLKNPSDPYCNFNNDFIVVDESSFVDDKIYEELEDNCKKIIYIGDSYQLSLNRSNKLENVDIRLTEPIRFSEESIIGRLATKTRIENKLPFNYKYNPIVDWGSVKNYDIIVCYKNYTRNLVNINYRKHILGKTGLPEKGEKLIFLFNSNNNKIFDREKKFKIVNGLIFTLEYDPILFKEIDGQGALFEYQGIYFYFGDSPFWAVICTYSFKKSSPKNKKAKIIYPVAYAYAITCHKAQGSEWDNVLLLKETNDPHYLYTGITRAKKVITLADRIG